MRRRHHKDFPFFPVMIDGSRDPLRFLSCLRSLSCLTYLAGWHSTDTGPPQKSFFFLKHNGIA